MSDESEAKPKPTVKRLTDDQLREFVNGCCDGRIFTSAQIRNPNDIPLVFQILALGGLSNFDEEEIKKIGVIWEWMSESGPRSINNMPMFLSMRIMHIDDWKRAAAAIDKELARRKSIEV